MGLLGDSWDDPKTMATMQLAAGLLGGGNFGQAAGRGLAGYQAQMAAAQEQELRRQYMQAQQAKMREYEQAQALKYRIQGAARESWRSPEQANAMSMGPMPDGSNVQPVRPGFDSGGFVNRVMEIDPLKGLEYKKAFTPESQVNKLDVKDFTPESVQRFSQTGNYGDLKRMDKLHFADTGGAIAGLDPFTGQTVGGTNKTGNPFADLLIQGANGIVPNSPLIDAKQRIAASGAGRTVVNMADGQKGFDNEFKLRDGFKSEPIYKEQQDMSSAYKQIQSSLGQATPIGDVAAATKIMKLLDPGSVVRESELAISMAAAGRLDRLQHYAENMVNGTKLTPQQRQDFSSLAGELMQASTSAYNQKRGEYLKQGNDYGLNGERAVGPEFKIGNQSKPAAMPLPQNVNQLTLKKGQRYTLKDNKVGVWDGKGFAVEDN